jgi:fatty-acyl-CoA synthase
MNEPRFPTILHAFLDSLAANPDAPVLEIVEGPEQCETVSFAKLFELASAAAAGYDAHRLSPGDRVTLALPTSRDFFALYIGALFRRIIPLVEPLHRGAQARVILSDGTAFEPAEFFTHGSRNLLPLVVTPDDVSHLQATSGSTGQQKLAIVSHRNIVANVSAIGARLKLEPDDKLAIWLPLYHDMGLIAVACTFYWQRPMVLTDPVRFAVHPIRYWLQMIDAHRATITAAPNSAYAICARLARRRRFEGLDLSRLRAAFWGAEPIHPDTVHAFNEAFAPYGFRHNANLPVYGLAEATLAVTMSEVDEPPRVQTVSTATPRPSVAVGRPIDGHRLRIVDAARNELPHGASGEIEVQGPSIIRGYWDGTPCAELDGFMRTGDIGMFLGDQLHVVGRLKEILIVGGRNFVPTEIETTVEALLDNGIIQGVAAFGLVNPRFGTEEVHLLIESRVLPVPHRAEVEDSIRRHLDERLGLAGVIVHWTPRGTIPKTTSGKIQRFRCGEIVAVEIEHERTARLAGGVGPWTGQPSAG